MADLAHALTDHVMRHEIAIRTIAEWLSQEHRDFDFKTIDDILNGKKSEEQKEE